MRLHHGQQGERYVVCWSHVGPGERVAEHREGLIEGFTKRFGVKRLVWFEQHETMESAIVRETQLKKWNRAWKLREIGAFNPDWRDLYVELVGPELDARLRGHDDK